jgi:hypothetical protein
MSGRCPQPAAADCAAPSPPAPDLPACWLPCSTMSLKSCRQKLEEDMGLESGALKPFKQLLSDNIDKVPGTAGAAHRRGCLVARLPLSPAAAVPTCCCAPRAAP